MAKIARLAAAIDSSVSATISKMPSNPSLVVCKVSQLQSFPSIKAPIGRVRVYMDKHPEPALLLASSCMVLDTSWQ